jgi:regulator of RNase E activity RraA
VVLEANDDKVAHSGDITSLIYQKLGAVGWVSDGKVRDIEKINKTNFQVYCNGTCPIDALDYWALTEFQVPIKLCGLQIYPSDYLFCSSDGIIRVKKEFKSDLPSAIESVFQKEKSVRDSINATTENSVHNLIKNLEQKYGRW